MAERFYGGVTRIGVETESGIRVTKVFDVYIKRRAPFNLYIGQQRPVIPITIYALTYRDGISVTNRIVVSTGGIDSNNITFEKFLYSHDNQIGLKDSIDKFIKQSNFVLDSDICVDANIEFSTEKTIEVSKHGIQIYASDTAALVESLIADINSVIGIVSSEIVGNIESFFDADNSLAIVSSSAEEILKALFDVDSGMQIDTTATVSATKGASPESSMVISSTVSAITAWWRKLEDMDPYTLADFDNYTLGELDGYIIDDSEPNT